MKKEEREKVIEQASISLDYPRILVQPNLVMIEHLTKHMEIAHIWFSFYFVKKFPFDYMSESIAYLIKCELILNIAFCS